MGQTYFNCYRFINEIDKTTLPPHSCDADILSMSLVLFMWLSKQYGIQQLERVPLISTCANIH